MKFKTHLQEAGAGIKRVEKHALGDRNIGIISAERGYESRGPENQSKTPDEWRRRNNEAHVDLGHDIRAAGYGFIRVNGRSREGDVDPKPHNERSYLVVGKHGDDGGHLLNTLKTLGNKYQQDSVLHKTYTGETGLHGLKPDGWPKKGEVVDQGTFHPDKVGEYYTKMRHGNHTFTYEDVYFYSPGTMLNRQDAILTTERVLELIESGGI